MKVKRIIVKNVGPIADTTVELDKPLILFYGELCQGKTTLLNAVKWVFGGSYPSDIIRHGQAEASVTLEFENGLINREWYRGKDGHTKDRPIAFFRVGEAVKRPVDEIKKFLNPYLLDNEFFKSKNELERKKYLLEIFAVDTSELDYEAIVAEGDAKDLRVKVKAYGVIDTTEVELLDVRSVKEELAEIRFGYQAAKDRHEAETEIIRDSHLGAVRAADAHNSGAAARRSAIHTRKEEIARLEEEIEQHKQWLVDYPEIEPMDVPLSPTYPDPPVAPDTAELEARISQGGANKVLYEAYQERLKKAAEKAADEKLLADLETKIRDIKKQKIAKLKEIDTGGIQGLSFDEDGNSIYEGTQASMLSTSQIMRLSGELSSLYPQGFGLELIDRANAVFNWGPAPKAPKPARPATKAKRSAATAHRAGQETEMLGVLGGSAA